MINLYKLPRALFGTVLVILFGFVAQAKGEDLAPDKLIPQGVHNNPTVFNTVRIDAAHPGPRQGFLKRARRPNIIAGRQDPLFDKICETAERYLSPLNCAPSLTNRVGVRNFLPPPIIGADLPHLRLDIVLTRMEHKAVSGGGVAEDPANLSDDLWAHWKFQSASATSSIPGPADEAYGLPVPPDPGEAWTIDHSNGLFQGIISNGCSNSTVFDVDLVSDVFRLDNTTLAAVHLQDETVGNGFYVFSYTIRATDSDGGVSDFIFSGDARAYCTAQGSF